MRRRLVLCLMLLCGCGGGSDSGADRGGGARAALDIRSLLAGADTLHERAFAPRPFVFPDDHGAHERFRSEWWYFTGSLTAGDGTPLGYQLTFFRSALLDSAAFAAAADSPRSAWRTRHAYMAHFTVTHPRIARFHAAERFSRAAVGMAGVHTQPFRVWLGTWSAASADTGMFPLHLQAEDADVAIDLLLQRGRDIVLQGDKGLSRKGAQPGNASYYYSLTRMPTRGTVRVANSTYRVTGSSWLDREWSTSALAADVEGWDWLSLQLDDHTELMLYRLRRADGTADPYSAGMFIDSAGHTTPLSAHELVMTPVRTWSAEPGAPVYPVEWDVTVPSLGLDLRVEAVVDHQELRLAVRYWEGMVRAEGARGENVVAGRGYLELTGY